MKDEYAEHLNGLSDTIDTWSEQDQHFVLWLLLERYETELRKDLKEENEKIWNKGLKRTAADVAIVHLIKDILRVIPTMTELLYYDLF